MTLNPVCESVETKLGVAVSVSAVAQVKFSTTRESLLIAMEQFLGKSPEEISNVLVQTLEGHLRAILGTLTVEEIYRDREKFAAFVLEVAAPDVSKMGVEILSFTVKDISDRVGYLESLGKKRTAEVKRDASNGVVEAERDAGIRIAAAERVKMEARFSADTKVAESKRALELAKSEFDQDVNRAKAEAELAYQLEAAKVQQSIREANVEIEVVARRKQIEVEEQEILRKQKELEATVQRPADAESFKVETLAQANSTQVVTHAEAEAEAIRATGAAEASVIEATGTAEANRMRLKATAFKEYGEAAMMSLALDALPKIAAEIAAPLAKVDQIVLVSGGDASGTSSTAGEVSRLVSELPPVVRAITGVDLSQVRSPTRARPRGSRGAGTDAGGRAPQTLRRIPGAQ